MSIRRRPSRSIGFKAFCDTDADILNWWETLPAGARSDTLRGIIRASFVEGSTSPSKIGKADNTQLAQINADTVWIPQVLSDFPAYLEQLVERFASERPAVHPLANTTDDTTRLDEQAIEHRRAKMKNATW